MDITATYINIMRISVFIKRKIINTKGSYFVYKRVFLAFIGLVFDPKNIYFHEVIMLNYPFKNKLLAHFFASRLRKKYPKNLRALEIMSNYYHSTGNQEKSFELMSFLVLKQEKPKAKQIIKLIRHLYVCNETYKLIEIFEGIKSPRKYTEMSVFFYLISLLNTGNIEKCYEFVKWYLSLFPNSMNIERIRNICVNNLKIPINKNAQFEERISNSLDYYFYTNQYSKAKSIINQDIKNGKADRDLIIRYIDLLMIEQDYLAALEAIEKYESYFDAAKYKMLLKKIICECQLGNMEAAMKSFKLFKPYAITRKAFSYDLFQVYASMGDYHSAFSLYKHKNISVDLNKFFPNRHAEGIETVCIVNAGGPGDELRFSSVNALLINKYKKVHLTCEPRLLEIFQMTYPEISFFPLDRFRLEYPFDIASRTKKIKSVSVSHICDDTFFELAKTHGNLYYLHEMLVDLRSDKEVPIEPLRYLKLDPVKAKYWQNYTSSKRKKIGISWRSELLSPARNIHYFDIDQIIEVIEGIDAEMYILQHEIKEFELEKLTRKGIKTHIIDPKDLDQRNDFMNMAAFLNSLDFVVSPCTTVCELAGAIGKKCIVFSNSSINNYKQNARGHDIWHSSIQYIRPDVFGDKNDLVGKLRTAIQKAMN